MGLLGHLALLALQEMLEAQVLLAHEGLQDQGDHLETLDLRVTRDLQEVQVQMVLQDPLELQDLLVTKVQLAMLVHLEHQETLDLQDNQVALDLPVCQVFLA